MSNSWASTKVPAATIVAAWISADAGVGPSIASGSQSWNGTMPDLPSTPMTSSTMAAVRRVAFGASARSSVRAVRGGPRLEHLRVCRRAGARGEDHHPEHEADVGEPGDQERLERGRRADSLRLQWPMSR